MTRARFFLLILVIASCSKKLLHQSSNEIFSIGADCSFSKGVGTDALIGKVNCGNIHMEYDYSRYSPPGPFTDKEKFLLAFRGHHHKNFFERIYIDTKLSKFFIDSVQILEVSVLTKGTHNLLFKCPTCNKVATLEFRKKTYNYPWFDDPTQNENQFYDFYRDTLGNYDRKIYIGKTEKQQDGLYLEPLKNKKQGNKLAVYTSQNIDKETILTLLRTVSINPKRDE